MSYMYLQSFPPSKNPSSSELFWFSSYHQILLALQTQYQGKLLLDSFNIWLYG